MRASSDDVQGLCIERSYLLYVVYSDDALELCKNGIAVFSDCLIKFISSTLVSA